MGKGSRRRTFAVLAARKRSPEEIFGGLVLSMKVGKNRQVALVRKPRRERGRGG
jgi:hypothetical protein